MKKLLALLLTGMMVFTLASCGNKDNTAEPEDAEQSVETADDDAVEKITMVYGDDETKITLHKPENAEFTLGSDTPDDAGDLVGLCADDLSWDAEVMGYKYYEGIGSNEPFVDYYFAGSVNEEEYDAYDETVTELGIDYNGNPVKAIRYTFKEAGDDEEYKECFVGFEYKGTDDCGLMGIKIGAFEEDLEDSELKKLFSELFSE